MDYRPLEGVMLMRRYLPLMFLPLLATGCGSLQANTPPKEHSIPLSVTSQELATVSAIPTAHGLLYTEKTKTGINLVADIKHHQSTLARITNRKNESLHVSLIGSTQGQIVYAVTRGPISWPQPKTIAFYRLSSKGKLHPITQGDIATRGDVQIRVGHGVILYRWGKPGAHTIHWQTAKLLNLKTHKKTTITLPQHAHLMAIGSKGLRYVDHHQDWLQPFSQQKASVRQKIPKLPSAIYASITRYNHGLYWQNGTKVTILPRHAASKTVQVPKGYFVVGVANGYHLLYLQGMVPHMLSSSLWTRPIGRFDLQKKKMQSLGTALFWAQENPHYISWISLGKNATFHSIKL